MQPGAPACQTRRGLDVQGVTRDLHELAAATNAAVKTAEAAFAALFSIDPTALPVMRPLALHWPADEDAAREDTQYLLGEGLLVAPVLRAGHRRRLVYLPAGRWAATREPTRGQPSPSAAVARP